MCGAQKPYQWFDSSNQEGFEAREVNAEFLASVLRHTLRHTLSKIFVDVDAERSFIPNLAALECSRAGFFFFALKQFCLS
jgi:hypothetical protein